MEPREILLSQAVGEYVLYRNDPDVWESKLNGFAQQLESTPDAIENEVHSLLRRAQLLKKWIGQWPVPIY